MHQYTTNDHKRCSRCKEVKPLEAFYKCSRTSDGRQSYCIDCVREVKGYKRPRVKAPEGYKFCYHCQQTKPLSEFHKDGASTTGVSSKCKSCSHEYEVQSYSEHAEEERKKARERYHRDVELSRERDRQRRQNADFRESRRLHAKAWRSENPDYDRNRVRDLDQKRASTRKWSSEHQHIRRVHRLKRKAVKRALPDSFSHEDYSRMMEYWGYKCAVSGETENLHVDHWIPLSSPDCPGTVAWNMIPLAARLNISKLNHHPHKWLVSKFGDKRAQEIEADIQRYFEWVKHEFGRNASL